MTNPQTISPPGHSGLPAPGSHGLDKWFQIEWETRAVGTVIGLFVVLWTAFQIISYQPIDLHTDLVEVFAWSRHPSASYDKHPPLAALIAAAWFAMFPIADWSFHLLAMVNSAVALYFVDLIARRHLGCEKRLLVFAFLLLTPFYQFHGQRFSTNQVLLSTWPVATYCFLRAFENRRLFWSIAAGATAALAMLGKYYSVYLIAGFVVAALSHPNRMAYLRSPSPYFSALTGCAVLAPHLLWLIEHGFRPAGYAMLLHGGFSATELLSKIVLYAVGGVAYVALAIAVYLAAVRPGLRTVASAFWPADPDRRMLVILLAVPLVLPMLSAPLFGIALTSLWTMSAWFLLPIVLLMPADIDVSRRVAIRATTGVLALALVAVAAAPAVGAARLVSEGTKDTGRAYYRMVSAELTNAWHSNMQRPLTIVAGTFDLALAVTFYSSDHPDSLQGFRREQAPWVTDTRLKQEGWASICFSNDEDCLARTAELARDASNVVHLTYTGRKSWFGIEAAPIEFKFLLVPPQP